MWDGGNIDIYVTNFCDADGNINNARLILNKGGQTLNLLCIDNDTDLSNGYNWLLLDNNFDFI